MMIRTKFDDSPVSNNGRGLKRLRHAGQSAGPRDSPVSNNGRGLKHVMPHVGNVRAGIRPLAITGVD